MRLLTLLAPGGDPWQESVSMALERWNRGLDIRLRFLNIGIEEVVVVLDETTGPGEPEASGLEQVEREIERFSPAAILLHGTGPLVLAAAVSASKAGIRIARTGAGGRDGAGASVERAADALCTALLVESEALLGPLEAEGLLARSFVAPGGDEEAVDRALRRLLPQLRGR